MIPVAVAKIVAVRRTPKNRDPLTPPKMYWNDLKRRSINPASSIIWPIKTKSGTAARVSSFINPTVWRTIW